MTDPTPRPDDELVSAVLDGEASDDERARVEADPAARARLAELRAVRDLVAAPVTVPAAARDAAIAAALAQFDVTTAPGEPASPAPEETPQADELAARRARRGTATSGRFLAAAAAIVVLVLGAAAVVRVLNPPAEVTAASSPTAQSTRPPAADGSSDGGADSATEPAPGEAAATTTTAPAEANAPLTTISPVTAGPTLDALGSATVVTVDLGELTSPRELRDRMLAIVDTRTAETASGAPAPTTVPAPGSGSFADVSAFASCASYLDAVDPELDQLLAVGAATYEGRRATVFAFGVDQVAHPAANGSIRIYAVDPTTCAPLSVLTTR